MPCFRPLRGYRARRSNASGKFPVVFNVQDGFADRPISLPCGQCVGCRLERSRQWALRCMHEAKQYEDNCFITLTYREADLPEGRTLVVGHWQDFMKRLKSQVRRDFGKARANGIKFYHCGEYGERFGRPHYHACLFNFDFPDKVYKRVNANGDKIYTSDYLAKLWPFGEKEQLEIGSVTFESAAYVARYIMKKITGDQAEQYYWYVDDDGVVYDRKPEYTTMSNGIGKAWFKKFSSDVFPADHVVYEGKRHRVPRYYDSLFEMMLSDIDSRKAKLHLKGKRVRAAKKHSADNTPERRKVRETVQLARLDKLKRGIE